MTRDEAEELVADFASACYIYERAKTDDPRCARDEFLRIKAVLVDALSDMVEKETP